MIIKGYIKGIVFVLLMLSVVGIVMGASGPVTGLNNVSYAENHINWTWTDPVDPNFTKVEIYLEGVYQADVIKGTQFYNASSLTQDTEYTIGTRTVNTSGNFSTWENHTARTAKAPDFTAPASVTGLSNTTFERNYITWTWTDPGDGDLDHVEVYLDGIFKENTLAGDQTYNATALTPDTQYNISTRTVDTSGNINSTWENHSATTAPPDLIPPASITGLSNTSYAEDFITWTWSDPGDGDFDHVEVYLDGVFKQNILAGTQSYNATGLSGGTDYNVSTRTADTSSNINSTWIFHIARTKNPSPSISITSEPSSSDLNNAIVDDSLVFDISVSQTADIEWKVGVGTVQGPTSGTTSSYTFNPSSVTNYTVRVEVSNGNGTDSKEWEVIAHSKSFKYGDRIWDANTHSTNEYKWDAYSFAGFYYDLDDNVATEELTIKNVQDTIQENDIIYESRPQEVGHEYSGFGNYSVIGFMADKFFAGYNSNSVISGSDVMSTISSKQLHKVLLDDDDKRTISEGGTLTLKEGYVLKLTAVDIGAGSGQIWVTLLKDGSEIDSDVVGGGDAYIFDKKVGKVNNLPIIAVNFDKVFRGREINAAFIEGVFQISESYTSVNTGDRYGEMEISSVSASRIQMKNENSVDLSRGSTVDLMGDLKIIVADDSTLRFALTVERTGTFEARGTVYNKTQKWTPMNFGLNVGGTSLGFFYDMDDGLGTESLEITSISGDTIPDNGLTYSTSPTEVNFDYSPFGKYQVIGFMAEKYFAGYTGNTDFSDTKSLLSNKQLHEVLLDDDEKRTISEGGTLTLKEGYVLKMTAVDIGAGAGMIWVSLLKDGSEVDSDVIESGEAYTFAKKVGKVSDLVIIAVNFDKVFRGREINAAFIEGIFQISESHTSVSSGSSFGEMEVSSVGGSGITMKNENSIDLSPNSVIDLMGDIKFRVADDSNDVRFYPYILVTPEMVANQLVIDAPNKANAGETITINIKAGGDPVENATVTLDGEIGETDEDGNIDYELPKELEGSYNITATKLGYEKATSGIEIEEFIDLRLTIEAPTKTTQFEEFTIKVTYNGTAISGADVEYDDENIGETNSDGYLNYTPDTTGIHTITASRTGYFTVTREIDVVAPFSEFKTVDINVTPPEVLPDQEIVVKANITNVGNKADTLPIELVINGTTVANRSVTLEPGGKQEINFTGNIEEWKVDEEVTPGNYTVTILDMDTKLVVVEKPLDLFLIAGIFTGVAAVLIYFVTAKGITIETIRNLDAETIKSALSKENISRNLGEAKNKINTENISRSLGELGGKIKEGSEKLISKIKK